MDYLEFRETDFRAFFNVSEIGRSKDKQGRILVAMKPGGFQEHVDITLIMDDIGNVTGGELVLNRGWTGDWTSVNPFAKDIAKSFLYALIPRSDQSAARGLIDGIWELVGAKDRLVLVRGPPKPPTDPDVIAALDCFMGHTERKSLTYAASRVDLVNFDDKGGPWLRISVLVR